MTTRSLLVAVEVLELLVRNDHSILIEGICAYIFKRPARQWKTILTRRVSSSRTCSETNKGHKVRLHNSLQVSLVNKMICVLEALIAKTICSSESPLTQQNPHSIMSRHTATTYASHAAKNLYTHSFPSFLRKRQPLSDP